MAQQCISLPLRARVFGRGTACSGFLFKRKEPLVSSHLPVLPQEVLSLLEPKAGELFLDATFGGGGHTRLFLESGVDVVAIDRDPEAEVRASLYKEEWGDRFEFFRLNFDQIDQLPQERFDGIFLDRIGGASGRTRVRESETAVGR